MKTIRVYDENGDLIDIVEIPVGWGPMKIRHEMYRLYPNFKYYE